MSPSRAVRHCEQGRRGLAGPRAWCLPSFMEMGGPGHVASARPCFCFLGLPLLFRPVLGAGLMWPPPQLTSDAVITILL